MEKVGAIVVDLSNRGAATKLGELIDALYEAHTLADMWKISKSIQDIGGALEDQVRTRAETYMLDAAIQSFLQDDIEFTRIPAKTQMCVNVQFIRQEFPICEYPECYTTVRHKSYTSVRVRSEVTSESDPELEDATTPEEKTKMSYHERVDSVRKTKPRAWTAWTVEDEDTLIEGFESGMTLDELADSLQRQVGGIRSRLKRLGYII